jgi:hypothetical protein
VSLDFSLDGLTPALASLLHVGAVHRRRVRERRTSDIDMAALATHLRHVQHIWPPHSSQRQMLDTSIQTVITWIEEYVQTGRHADNLDAILQGAFVTAGSPQGLHVFAAWVRDVNTDGCIIVRVAEQDLRVTIEDVTSYLPWWLLAEDVVFTVGLT